MRLGVVSALEPEIRAFGVRPRRGRAMRHTGASVLRAVSGVGANRAYATGKRLVEQGATALVSWGTAAALVPALHPGALLLPRKVIARDGSEFAIDGEWQQRVRERLATEGAVHTEPLVEVGEPLLSVADKRMLAQHSGAVAADMESAALQRSPKKQASRCSSSVRSWMTPG